MSQICETLCAHLKTFFFKTVKIWGVDIIVLVPRSVFMQWKSRFNLRIDHVPTQGEHVFPHAFTGERTLSRVLRVVWRQKLLNLTQFELVSWLRSDGEHRSRQSNSGSLLQYRDRTLSEPKSAKSAFRAILEPIWLFQTRIAFNYDKKTQSIVKQVRLYSFRRFWSCKTAKFSGIHQNLATP